MGLFELLPKNHHVCVRPPLSTGTSLHARPWSEVVRETWRDHSTDQQKASLSAFAERIGGGARLVDVFACIHLVVQYICGFLLGIKRSPQFAQGFDFNLEGISG